MKVFSKNYASVLEIPKEQIFRSGNSKASNPRIQSMFLTEEV